MSLNESLIMLGKCILLTLVCVHVAPIMAWVERRGSALMQGRLGPNRIGPFGLFQSVADGIKFIFKEDPIPAHVNRFYYVLAPLVSMIPAFLTFAVIPIAEPVWIGDYLLRFQVANLDVGLLFILAVSSLGVFGVIMAGWASNNKYAMLGSLRSSSQMISYELSMGISLIGIIMAYSSVNINDITAGQGQIWFELWGFGIPKWGILIQPLGFLIFLTSVFAETNRLPFDLPEGESEIVAGYHLEYGSMKFAIFQMAEYTNMFTGAGLLAALYFGGWQMLPFLPQLHEVLGGGDLLRIAFQIGSFAIKVGFFMWFFVWVRWTIPRFRYDQVMNLGWKVLLPLSLLNLFVTGLLIYYKVI